jgi:hypothetical protein
MCGPTFTAVTLTVIPAVSISSFVLVWCLAAAMGCAAVVAALPLSFERDPAEAAGQEHVPGHGGHVPGSPQVTKPWSQPVQVRQMPVSRL